MKIQQDLTARNKFHSGFDRTKDVEWLVVHGTAGGGTLNWVNNAPMTSARARMYSRGIALFHYLIDRDGTVTEIISPNKWVYHASIGQLDCGTIGVEMLNKTRDNSGKYTDEQYESLVALYMKLRRAYPKMGTMLSHRRCQQKVNPKAKWFKNCPGTGFNWGKLKKTLSNNNLSFKSKSEFESIWGINDKT